MRFIKNLALDGIRIAHPLIPRCLLVAALRTGGLHSVPSTMAPREYEGGTKGALVVSLDFEYPQQDANRSGVLRETTIEILELANDYRIPMTWGICGNAGLREIDLLREIQLSSVEHDVGVHTFSHRYVGRSECPVCVIEKEVRECVEVIESTKRRRMEHPRTFIFPGNVVGNLNTIRSLGFLAYRGNTDQLGYPSRVHGLWDIAPSYFLNEKTIGELGYLRRLLDVSSVLGCVLHLWSHPWNMILKESARDYRERVLEPLFHYADCKRKQGLLWICNMREMAEYCEARHSSKALSWT
jgi:peptidoglycan/xylan/chitin deacetylase (PgdA/CDA1 family)